MMSEKFTIGIRVGKDDIDNLEHVNNVVYVQWIQDAAAAHWDQLASKEILDTYFWVVLKHEVNYKASAFLNDELEATTWVDTIEGVRSDRIGEIRRKSDHKLLVEARTTWCLMSRATQRPTRIGDDLKQVFARKLS